MIIRDLDSHECYEIHKRVSRELVGTAAPLIFESQWQGHILTKNRFPYRTPHDHWVLWIQPRYERFYTLDRVREIVGDCVDLWENPDSLKSILEIKHYHIFRRAFDGALGGDA